MTDHSRAVQAIPSKRLLLELAKALQEAEHRNVAEHMLAGVLWAMYPDWFDKTWRQ